MRTAAKALTKKQAVRELKKRYSRPQAVKELDKAFGDYIKARDGRCMQGGNCNGPLTCGHLITRANHSTRWDERNAFGQCRGHNFSHEFHPETMTAWYIKEFGLEQYESLVFRSRQRCGLKTTELRMLAEEYRQKTKKLLDKHTRKGK